MGKTRNFGLALKQHGMTIDDARAAAALAYRSKPITLDRLVSDVERQIGRKGEGNALERLEALITAALEADARDARARRRS